MKGGASMLGIFFALVPLVCWGSIGLVSNLFGGNPKQQTLGMTMGAFVFALITFLIFRPQLSWPVALLGFVGGLIWAIGQSGQFQAMKALGVSIASPLSAGSQLVLGALIGVIAFGEWTVLLQYILGTIAIAFLLVGFYFSAKSDPENDLIAQKPDYRKGILALSYSTLGYVAYVILFNNLSGLWFHLHFDTVAIILPMSVGMIVGALILAGREPKINKAVFMNMIVGVMWGFGNIGMLYAAKIAGNAIAFAFSQLGMVISIIGGIVFLGEKKTKKEMNFIILGTSAFIIGAILLAIVKSQS
jgi:glucose uptake protein